MGIDQKELALQSFLQKNFDDAMKHYALALSENPDDKEARIGTLLSDMASENESEATALFEYYLSTKDEEDSEEIIESIVRTFDDGMELVSDIAKEVTHDDIVYQHGISYDDFVQLIEDRGSFKEAYQDIILSSRVVITRREDFIDFIGHLIENGYKELAYNYLENALKTFITDSDFLALFQKIEQMDKD